MITKQINYKEAVEFLLPKHYSGRKPVISIAFGWFHNDELMAVCTFGKPASNSLCKGVCGEEYTQNVYELNRLCRTEDLNEPLSKFVSSCLKELKQKNWIIISYADTAMNHNGYIYQATNWYYTGATKSRTDKYVEGNKHSRHYSNDNQNGRRKVRSSKHRYIYFCAKSKTEKKRMLNNLNYVIQSYPKNENKNYILGEYIKPIIINGEK